MKKYRVFGVKPKARIHRIHPKTGVTMCQAENNVARRTLVQNFKEMPEGRAPCKLCLSLCERTIKR